MSALGNEDDGLGWRRINQLNIEKCIKNQETFAYGLVTVIIYSALLLKSLKDFIKCQ